VGAVILTRDLSIVSKDLPRDAKLGKDPNMTQRRFSASTGETILHRIRIHAL